MKILKIYESFEPEEEWEEYPIYIFKFNSTVYLIERISDDGYIYLFNNFRWLKINSRYLNVNVREIKKEIETDVLGPTIEGILNNEYGIYIHGNGGFVKYYYKDLPHDIRDRITFDLSDILKTNESFEPEEHWEKEMFDDEIEELSPLFNKFLLNNRIKDKFIEEFENGEDFRINSEIYLNDFLRKKHPSGYIDYAFDWSKTSDGYDYWDDIHIEWVEYYSEYSLMESFNTKNPLNELKLFRKKDKSTVLDISNEPEEEWEENFEIEPNKKYYVTKDKWKSFSSLLRRKGYRWITGRVIRPNINIFLNNETIIYTHIGRRGLEISYSIFEIKKKKKKSIIYESFNPEEHWEEDINEIEPNTIYKVMKEDWNEFSNLLDSNGYRWKNGDRMHLFSNRNFEYIYILVNTKRFEKNNKNVITALYKTKSIEKFKNQYDMNYIEF